MQNLDFGKCGIARGGGVRSDPPTKVQDFGNETVQNLIIPKYELNISCWKLNFEWKNVKLTSLGSKLAIWQGRGVRSDPSRTECVAALQNGGQGGVQENS